MAKQGVPVSAHCHNNQKFNKTNQLKANSIKKYLTIDCPFARPALAQRPNFP